MKNTRNMVGLAILAGFAAWGLSAQGATPRIVPRGDGQGGIGTSSNQWGEGQFKTVQVGTGTIAEAKIATWDAAAESALSPANVTNDLVLSISPSLTDTVSKAGTALQSGQAAEVVHKHVFADTTNRPTTVQGYGITDAVTNTDARLTDARTPVAHVQDWASVTGKPAFGSASLSAAEAFAGSVHDHAAAAITNPPWIRTDGSVPMAGDLDLGGHSITNVGTNTIWIGAVGIGSDGSNLTTKVGGGSNTTVVTTANIAQYEAPDVSYSSDGYSIQKVGNRFSVAPWITDNLIALRYETWNHWASQTMGLLDGPGYWFSDTNGLDQSASEGYSYSNGYRNIITP
jgi:hypothetical protein